MPGPKAKLVELKEAERKRLESISKAYKTGQQLSIRSQIILLAGEGKNNSEIGREMNISVDTARCWRERWVALAPIPLEELSIEERLEDLPRPGAPSKITADQRCQIVALACESPEKEGRPISHWTGRELADELMKKGIVESISARHAQRLFKRSRPQTSSDPILANAIL